jgi:hypothetical protein
MEATSASSEDSGARAWGELRRAALVAGAAVLAMAPEVCVQAMGDRRGGALLPLEVQLCFGLAVSAALLGSCIAPRLGLAGVPALGGLGRAWPLFVVLAPLLAAASYVVVDRPLASLAPDLVPGSVAAALARALRGAVFEEVVARFGLLTVLMFAARRLWLANLAQALFFTATAGLSLLAMGLEPGLGALASRSLVVVFVAHLLQGAIAGRFGLPAAVLFHGVVGQRFVLLALLG